MMKAEIIFSSEKDSRESSIDEMGDGLRSIFYISMIESLLEIEAEMLDKEKNGLGKSIDLSSPVLTILAVEEPENHISPQLLGKLTTQLRSISQKDDAQVILTSHSPAIVKRIDPEEIRYFRLEAMNNSTEVKEITLPDEEDALEQFKFVKEAVMSYPELYFSKLVILGEGDSEQIILSRFFELNGENIDISEISIVPLGGRFVNHFWRLLSGLGTPYITLLDLDRERYGGGWGRIKYALKQLIKIGADRNKLLLLSDSSILTEERLDDMHNVNIMDVDNMNAWINRLEQYNVFFSNPLDIDFVMLEQYKALYKSSLSKNEGPVVKIEEKSYKIKDVENVMVPKQRYIDKVNNAVKQTFKEQGSDGDTYNWEQKQLMIWYNYFFLGRGKPITHISMFSKASDEVLNRSIPEVIQKIITSSQSAIKGEERR